LPLLGEAAVDDTELSGLRRGQVGVIQPEILA
jgi:hypothetical protein